MKKIISDFQLRLQVSALLFLFFIPLLNLNAQSFAPTNLYNGWNGSTAFATVPTATSLTFSQFFRGSGINAPAPVTSGITSNGWDGPTNVTAAEAANKFFYFTITSNATNPFNVTSMMLSLQRSSTGPGNFQMEYSVNSGPYLAFGNPFSNSSSSAFSATVTAATSVFVPAGQNVVFRLVCWNASSATGTFRINNNTAINGSVFSLTTTNVTGAPFCVNATLGAATDVTYSSTGTFASGNVFYAELSDASGSFASPVTIGTLPGNAATGIINAIIPAGTLPGNGYRIRVKSSAPAIDGADNGVDISIGGVGLSYTVTDITCNGNGNGAVNTTITSGVGPFTYSWSTSATTPSISGLSGGTYSLTVTDNGGCSTTISAVVNEPAPLTGNATSTNVQCNGDANGAVNLAVGGGTMPYSFSWSNSATAQNISGISVGTYSVSITDNQGCTQTASATITEPPVLNVSATSTNVNCNGGTNGTANLNVTGGTFPYSYFWNNAATTQNLTNLIAGSYSVTITDNNGCLQNTSVTITEPAGMNVTVTSMDVNCNGGNNGSANLNVTGGTFPYSFSWSNTAITQNISNVAAGTYSVIITDNAGCSQTSSVTITAPSAVTVAASSTNVNCSGGSNGTASLTVNGGVSPYSYSWSNSATTQNISALTAGTYTVLITDNNGCTQTSSVTITAPSAVTVAASSTNVNCNGGGNGTASLTVNGGVSPYS
ncbi:MAG: SprB repeat-containing protein [Bacteroidia bacterium]